MAPIILESRSGSIDAPQVEREIVGYRSPTTPGRYLNKPRTDPHYHSDRKPDEWCGFLDGLETAYNEGRNPVEEFLSGENTEIGLPAGYFRMRHKDAKRVDKDLDFEVIPHSFEDEGDIAYRLVKESTKRGLDAVLDLHEFSPVKGCYGIMEYPAKRVDQAGSEFLNYFREETGTVVSQTPCDVEEARLMKLAAEAGVLEGKPLQFEWAA